MPPGSSVPILLTALEREHPVIKTFLAEATAQDAPEIGLLVAEGIKRWDADDLLRRLRQAGELKDDGHWVSEAREAYRLGLAGNVSDSKPTTTSLPMIKGDGPRERAQDEGIEALDDHELLAVLLRTGGEEGVINFARRLLDEHDGLVGLSRMHIDELLQSHGLGPAKATEIAAAFELAKRLAAKAQRERVPLKSPDAVAALLLPQMVSLAHEEFWCLPLDSRCQLIGTPRVVSKGDIDGTDAGPRAFFRLALKAGAVSAIAAHNHPTGDPAPSKADLAVTRRLVAGGRAVGVNLDDHLIIGDGGEYTSLRRTHPECWSGQ